MTDKSTLDAAIELGAASQVTLGGNGHSTDFVREIPMLGLAED